MSPQSQSPHQHPVSKNAPSNSGYKVSERWAIPRTINPSTCTNDRSLKSPNASPPPQQRQKPSAPASTTNCTLSCTKTTSTSSPATLHQDPWNPLLCCQKKSHQRAASRFSARCLCSLGATITAALGMRARRARCADPKDRGIGRRASEDSADDHTSEIFFANEITNICYGVFMGDYTI